MAERTARLGSMHYLDADGRYRTASAGDKIQVHKDFLDTFDQLNVLLGQKPGDVEKAADPPAESEPKKPVRRGRPPKSASE